VEQLVGERLVDLIRRPRRHQFDDVRADVATWRPGDTIPLSQGRALRVIATRLDDGTDDDPVSVLVVEAAED
jgi:hypothetical protein